MTENYVIYLLWVGAKENGRAVLHLAVHCGRLEVLVREIQIDWIVVVSQYLDSFGLHCVGPNKDSTAVVVGSEDTVKVWVFPNPPDFVVDKERTGPRATLVVIPETFERHTTADSWEEAQLTVTDNLEFWVADLELAPVAGIVRASAETDVRSAVADKVPDPLVSVPVEGTSEAKISATRKDNRRARWFPRLLQQRRLCDRDDRIVGFQKEPQGGQSVAD